VLPVAPYLRASLSRVGRTAAPAAGRGDCSVITHWEMRAIARASPHSELLEIQFRVAIGGDIRYAYADSPGPPGRLGVLGARGVAVSANAETRLLRVLERAPGVGPHVLAGRRPRCGRSDVISAESRLGAYTDSTRIRHATSLSLPARICTSRTLLLVNGGMAAGFASLRRASERVSICGTVRYSFRVIRTPESPEPQPDAQRGPLVPTPSPAFRRRAWLLFQRLIDPLAAPKSLPPSNRPKGR
jgi:hypothetical protein